MARSVPRRSHSRWRLYAPGGPTRLPRGPAARFQSPVGGDGAAGASRAGRRRCGNRSSMPSSAGTVLRGLPSSTLPPAASFNPLIGGDGAAGGRTRRRRRPRSSFQSPRRRGRCCGISNSISLVPTPVSIPSSAGTVLRGRSPARTRPRARTGFNPLVGGDGAAGRATTTRGSSTRTVSIPSSARRCCGRSAAATKPS